MWDLHPVGSSLEEVCSWWKQVNAQDPSQAIRHLLWISDFTLNQSNFNGDFTGGNPGLTQVTLKTLICSF